MQTIRIKKGGKWGAAISMNIATSLRMSAKSLKRIKQFYITIKWLFKLKLSKTKTKVLSILYLHFLASESNLFLKHRATIKYYKTNSQSEMSDEILPFEPGKKYSSQHPCSIWTMRERMVRKVSIREINISTSCTYP